MNAFILKESLSQWKSDYWSEPSSLPIGAWRPAKSLFPLGRFLSGLFTFYDFYPSSPIPLSTGQDFAVSHYLFLLTRIKKTFKMSKIWCLQQPRIQGVHKFLYNLNKYITEASGEIFKSDFYVLCTHLLLLKFLITLYLCI